MVSRSRRRLRRRIAGRSVCSPWVRPASDEIEAIAEDGNQVPAYEALKLSKHVTDVVDVGAPLFAGDRTTFSIHAAPGDVFSIAGMLICTNDGFTGLDGGSPMLSGSAVSTNGLLHRGVLDYFG